MSNLLTTSQVAQRWGRTRKRAHERLTKKNIKPAKYAIVNKRYVALWRLEDIERIENGN